MDDLNKVIKSLKTNQSSDPNGMISELFRPGIIGADLKSALLLWLILHHYLRTKDQEWIYPMTVEYLSFL